MLMMLIMLTNLKSDHLNYPREKGTFYHLAYLREKLCSGLIRSYNWTDTRGMVADGHTKGSIDRSMLAALPALVALPQHSWALFEAGPQGEFRSLVDSLSKVDDLTGQLQRGELKTADDALVVLQTATIYFKGIAATMDKATAEMKLLDAAEQERAAALTASFRQELEALFVGCRTKAPAAQQAAAEMAGGALREYLGVAAARYKVPALVQPARYSNDPEKFAAQYYGFLSCEGLS